MKTEMMSVPFQGGTVLIVEREGQPYVPVKPICDNLGIALQPQQAKFTTVPERWCITMIVMVAIDGKYREMLCLPLHKVPAWLMSISPHKVKPAIGAKLRAYQNECDTALWRYWTKDRAGTAGLVQGAASLVKGDQAVVAYTLKDVLKMQHRFNDAQEERISLLHWKAAALEAGYQPKEVRK